MRLVKIRLICNVCHELAQFAHDIPVRKTPISSIKFTWNVPCMNVRWLSLPYSYPVTDTMVSFICGYVHFGAYGGQRCECTCSLYAFDRMIWKCGQSAICWLAYHSCMRASRHSVICRLHSRFLVAYRQFFKWGATNETWSIWDVSLAHSHTICGS